ncbi:MAG: hypothetical protein ACR2GH_22685 [Pseudonocardia sp.]
MDDILAALVGRRRRPVPLDAWRSFWNRVDRRSVAPGAAAAVLASLSTSIPGPDTVGALLASLDERRPPIETSFPDAVNIVGTGGGPATFNISTAAAFVAAAMGVPVVKTGARAYTSRYGSFDLLDRLGVRRTTSYEHTEEVLQRCGIAFAGQFVYPREIAQLARAVHPLDMRAVAGIVNLLGPFLAAMPVGTLITGVSDHDVLPLLHQLASARSAQRTWLCTNDAGADELLSHVDNVVYRNDDTAGLWLSRLELGHAPGEMADLRPVQADDRLVPHFLDVLSGRAGVVASETVCLNAAALAVAAGVKPDWRAALTAARDALACGAAVDVVGRLRAQRQRVGAGSHG